MWMMGCSDGGEFSIPDSFNGRRLRPLIPRTTPLPSTNTTSNSSPPRPSRLHGTDFFSLNHHPATMADHNKRDFHTQPVAVSSRWNPTPEQLRTLEELYRRGTRTPSAEQIQHITAQLRRYGKIEGKNVFYWFQNHKARERQKRRRQLESEAPDRELQQQLQHCDIEFFERKESGASRTSCEGEQIKDWAPPTNYSTLPEESISIQGAGKSGVAECRPDGWIQFDELELQQRKSFTERNATWQMMNLSCPSSTYLINTTPSSAGINSTATIPSTTLAAEAATIRAMDPKLIKSTHDLNILIGPYKENGHGLINHLSNSFINEEDNGCGESQTLQLFPVRSSGDGGNGNEDFINEKDDETTAAMNANFTSHQYFEFLPLKT